MILIGLILFVCFFFFLGCCCLRLRRCIKETMPNKIEDINDEPVEEPKTNRELLDKMKRADETLTNRDHHDTFRTSKQFNFVPAEEKGMVFAPVNEKDEISPKSPKS